MSSKLDAFKTPANVTQGEIFEMDNGLKVRVTLPTLGNRKYQYAVMAALADDKDEDEEDRALTGLETAQRYEAMLGAFNSTCIVEIMDKDAPPLPLDMDEYALLIAMLYKMANERAAEENEKSEKRAKKDAAT